MIYVIIKLVHIFSVLIYGGFLFTDNLFLSKMKNDLSNEDHTIVREYFMKYVRVVVPKALIVAVASGVYLFFMNFGVISEDGLSNFQIVLGIKAFLGLWLPWWRSVYVHLSGAIMGLSTRPMLHGFSAHLSRSGQLALAS